MLVLVITNKVFLLKDENYYNYYNYTKQEKDSIDVLILGSSHSINGLGASELDRLLLEKNISVKTFNMSVTGLRFEMMPYRLKEALKTQSPKLLIVETFSAVPIQYSDEDVARRYAFDYMPLTLEKWDYINTYIPENKNSYLFPLLRYHSRWQELTKEDFYIFNSAKMAEKCRENGLIAHTADVECDKTDAYFEKDFSGITEEESLDPVVEQALKDLLQVAKNNQTKVLFISLPYKVQMGYDSEKLVRNNNYIRTNFCDETRFILDLNKCYADLQWSYHDMQDEGHMNASGREKIMPVLADFIAENYFD